MSFGLGGGHLRGVGRSQEWMSARGQAWGRYLGGGGRFQSG